MPFDQALTVTKQIEDTLLTIARDKLGVETLETRRADRLDFHDIAAWSIKDALAAAFRAGADYLQEEKPVVVITVQGGLVAEVNATSPVTVFVEDWDCPPDKPLVMDFDADALTPDQACRVAKRFAELNPSEKE
jgi:uncharacterized protein (DUF1684 family)